LLPFFDQGRLITKQHQVGVLLALIRLNTRRFLGYLIPKTQKARKTGLSFELGLAL
jgi:hypothetical protein